MNKLCVNCFETLSWLGIKTQTLDKFALKCKTSVYKKSIINRIRKLFAKDMVGIIFI